jgi:hypothetical protein
MTGKHWKTVPPAQITRRDTYDRERVVSTRSVALPEPFDPRWAHLPGIAVDDRRITIDPATYFFRFHSASWLVCDWDIVRTEFLDAQESRETALEQAALEFIRKHAHVTDDPAEVLSIAWQVYAYLFRDELLPVPGLTSPAAWSRSRPTQRSGGGWCMAASRCPTCPVVRVCRMAPRSRVSVTTSASSGISGCPPFMLAAPPSR